MRAVVGDGDYRREEIPAEILVKFPQVADALETRVNLVEDVHVEVAQGIEGKGERERGEQEGGTQHELRPAGDQTSPAAQLFLYETGQGRLP